MKWVKYRKHFTIQYTNLMYKITCFQLRGSHQHHSPSSWVLKFSPIRLKNLGLIVRHYSQWFWALVKSTKNGKFGGGGGGGAWIHSVKIDQEWVQRYQHERHVLVETLSLCHVYSFLSQPVWPLLLRYHPHCLSCQNHMDATLLVCMFHDIFFLGRMKRKKTIK